MTWHGIPVESVKLKDGRSFVRSETTSVRASTSGYVEVVEEDRHTTIPFHEIKEIIFKD